jgi:hypothetical protein
MKLYRAAAYPTSDGIFRSVVLVSDGDDPSFVREREVPGWECTTRDRAFKAAADYAEVLREYDVRRSSEGVGLIMGSTRSRMRR